MSDLVVARNCCLELRENLEKVLLFQPVKNQAICEKFFKSGKIREFDWPKRKLPVCYRFIQIVCSHIHNVRKGRL